MGWCPFLNTGRLVNLYLYFGYPTLITSGLDMSPGFRVPSFRWLNSPLLDRSSCAGVRRNKPLRVSWHAFSATKLLIRRGRILLPVTLKRGWILWPGMLFPFHPHVLLEQLCPKLVFFWVGESTAASWGQVLLGAKMLRLLGYGWDFDHQQWVNLLHFQSYFWHLLNEDGPSLCVYIYI